MKATKENTLIIRAGGGGYFHKGVIDEGFSIITPYIEKGGYFRRFVRELCFRLPFLPKEYWYNHKLLEKQYDYIIVWDPQVTADYLNWVKENQNKAQLNFIYGNMIGKANHINPRRVPSEYRKWSYEIKDCQKYNMRLFNNNPYFNSFVIPLEKPKYDVFYVGNDKGRSSFLLKLQDNIRKQGLITRFIVVKWVRFRISSSYQFKQIPYSQVCKYIAQSRAIVNIVLKGQTGISMRDIESLMFGVKLITNNPHIKDMAFYHPNNIYVLEDSNVDGLVEFLNKPLWVVPDEIRNRYSFTSHIQEITDNE